MKRLWLLIFVFYGCSVLSPLQKGRLISLYHLIETGKYQDAKVVAEELAEGEESSKWVNTWYARGMLCQTAYTVGMKNNDPKLYDLYPDQLYVAWDSYEKARKIDRKERMERQLAPKYVILANDFQKLGLKELKDENYQEALRAFEQTLRIEQLPFISLQSDTLLIYNTALAAYESQNWKSAVKYLSKLHSLKYSPNATHLLFSACLMNGDTAAAKKALYEGIRRYDDHENLVLLLTQILFEDNQPDEAMKVIDDAILNDPDNEVYHYSKGLIYQKERKFLQAIDSYARAISLNPDDVMAYVNIATCYYNIGVTHEEKALKLSNNKAVVMEREKSDRALRAANRWLDAAVKRQPRDPVVISKISRLYNALGKSDKAQNLLRHNE